MHRRHAGRLASGAGNTSVTNRNQNSDRIRCEVGLNDWQFGRVVADADGLLWVFVGWLETKGGRCVTMVRQAQPGERRSIVTPYVYSCAYLDTFRKRFPYAQAK